MAIWPACVMGVQRDDSLAASSTREDKEAAPGGAAGRGGQMRRERRVGTLARRLPAGTRPLGDCPRSFGFVRSAASLSTGTNGIGTAGLPGSSIASREV